MSVPSESFCSAHIGGEDGFQYPGGAGYTITPDIAMKLVKERPPLITQDDVSLGHALKNWNIPICLAKRIDVLSIPHYQVCKMRGIPEDVFHFRLKQNTRHDGGSEIETELKLMEQVIAEFCGKAFRVDHT